MIEAKELRIGNYVEFEKRVFQIDTIANEFPTLNTIEFGIGVVDWNNLKPIPLTEEWHIGFGAKKTHRTWFTYDFENVEISHNIENGVVNLFSNKNYEEPIIIKDIYSVHTFQNLYFALTAQYMRSVAIIGTDVSIKNKT